MKLLSVISFIAFTTIIGILYFIFIDLLHCDMIVPTDCSTDLYMYKLKLVAMNGSLFLYVVFWVISGQIFIDKIYPD